MRRTVLLVTAFALIAGILLALWVAEKAYVRPEVIVPGVSVGGMSFGGLTAAEASVKLKEYEAQVLSRPVRLECAGRSWPLPLQRIGIGVEATVLERALAVGHKGWLVRRYLERWRAAREGVKIPVRMEVEQGRLEAVVAELTRELTVLPQNAGFRVLPDDKIVVIPSREGRYADATAARSQVLAILNEGREPVVRIPLKRLPPEYTTADVLAMGLDCLLAEFSTSFDHRKVNRVYNISVAAGALNGLLVKPGEEVSFNKIVGPRSSEAGYKTAPTIVNNEFVEALGGGVCQVSTTLYNAVLLAGLEVVERHNHSLPVAYVSPGRDATVVYEGPDFRFRNNTGKFLYLRTLVQGNRLVIKIFGNERYKRRVEVRSWVTEFLEPKVVRCQDPNLEAGKTVVKQKGIRGCRALAERLVWEGNKLLFKEKLPPSFYHPVDEIIAVGTKVVPTIVAPETPPPEVPEQNNPPGGSATDAVYATGL
uniref:Vanomycin resistance protein VanB n=1 Tax=Ammonifex degensii TaxID=42838 RepID=A0A7C2IDP5_9THEO